LSAEIDNVQAKRLVSTSPEITPNTFPGEFVVKRKNYQIDGLSLNDGQCGCRLILRPWRDRLKITQQPSFPHLPWILLLEEKKHPSHLDLLKVFGKKSNIFTKWWFNGAFTMVEIHKKKSILNTSIQAHEHADHRSCDLASRHMMDGGSSGFHPTNKRKKRVKRISQGESFQKWPNKHVSPILHL